MGGSLGRHPLQHQGRSLEALPVSWVWAKRTGCGLYDQQKDTVWVPDSLVCAAHVHQTVMVISNNGLDALKFQLSWDSGLSLWSETGLEAFVPWTDAASRGLSLLVCLARFESLCGQQPEFTGMWPSFGARRLQET